MSFRFLFFMYVLYDCIYYYFLIYFIFLVARGIKPTSICCFHVLSSSTTQGGAGDRGRVCLLAGGKLDCSQSLSFPHSRRNQAHSLTASHLGFKCTGFSLGMTMKSTLGAAGPGKPLIWTILREDNGTVNSLVARKQTSPLLLF